MKTGTEHFDIEQKKQAPGENILLAILPFWDPLIPPMGISCLHGFLSGHGFNVRKADGNIDKTFMEIIDNYFNTLRQLLPEEKRSNFGNIGKEVLRNHMMAHINRTDQDEYTRLVRVLVLKTFFYDISAEQAAQLSRILDEFYAYLETYFLALLDEEKPGVVGLSVFGGTLAASVYAFRLVKEKYPHIKTLMGGGIFADELKPGTPDWETFLEKTEAFIDKIIIGEGELIFLKYLQGELPGNKRVYSLSDIGGKLLEISSAAIPDFSGLDLRYYASLASYTSRSCPFQCHFCSETVFWGKYRKKSAKQIVAELKALNQTHGDRLFLMSDSLLNPVINELARECLDTKTSLYWDGYLRVDRHSRDYQTAMRWRRGGFYRARLGVESGSTRVLNLMNKKITGQQIKDTISSLAHAGIKTTTYWIIGYPGETEEDFQETLDILEELNNDIYEAEFNTFRYYADGQVYSGQWAEAGHSLLYSQTPSHMLLLQTRVLDTPPSREETYQRLIRVREHCEKLRIPNPYSLHDIYEADKRWQSLHKNAVPPLLKLKDKNSAVEECHLAPEFSAAMDTRKVEGDWGF
jgi:hypothetical protein